MKRTQWLFLLLLTVAMATTAATCGGSSSSGSSSPAADDDTSPADDDDNDDMSPDDDDDNDSAGETTFTDSTTGLMWQNGENVGKGYYDWTDAANYCDALTWAGLSGWQLPSIDQLRTLIRGCAATVTGGGCTVSDASSCLDLSCDNSVCIGCAADGGPGGSGAYWPSQITGMLGFYYWSGSLVSDYNGYAWYVNFAYGEVDYEAISNVDMIVRCVRQP
jgi:hypothetical protein